MLTAFLPLLFSASATQISILRMRVEPSSTIWVDTTKEHMIWPWHLNQETQKSVRKAEVTLVSETTKPQTGMVFYPSTLDVLYNDKYEWVDTTKIFWCKFNYEELVGAGTKSKEEVRAGVLFFYTDIVTCSEYAWRAPHLCQLGYAPALNWTINEENGWMTECIPDTGRQIDSIKFLKWKTKTF